MGIGKIIGAAAPIAAGYFGGPALAGMFGGATGGAIAAGAMTGAGIAALSGQDVLGGAVTGGLGGLTGGGLQAAVQKATLTPGLTTGQLNKELMSPYTPAGGSLAGKGVGQASTMTAADATSGLATGGGYNPATGSFGGTATPNIAYTGQTSAMEPMQNAIARSSVTPSISNVAREFGGGSEAMGYGKMGLSGLGVAGQSGAFDVKPVTIGEEDKYDPTARLDLSKDTSISKALKKDTGLRLLAKGGNINAYTDSQLASLKEYGITPQYKHSMMGFSSPNFGMRQPVQGFVDVGGRFVAREDGDITDVDYEKEYKDLIYGNEKESQSGQDSTMLSKNKNMGSPAPALAKAGIASAYANQQQQGADFLKSQGLQQLANGGYLPSQDPHFQASGFGASRLDSLAREYDYGYANGGYLETGGEVGDGMSDDIPATIEGEQEARLSDGEFVVPADVVSHLGNGSSDAGAKRLYEMMDKIRMARTGTKKQGKEINPERFMPA